jgi:hypothetical protein
MNILYLILILIAIIVYIALFHVDAGYGKFFNPRWGPSIGNRAGWILMEAPAFIVMLIIYLASPARQMGSVVPLVFLLLFELHYFHRTFVFPFLLRGNNSMPLSVILMGACFNGGNAVLQGYCLFGTFAPLPFEPRPDSWLHSIPFLSGLIQVFGAALISGWVGLASYGGYLGMFDWDTVWPIFTVLMKYLGYIGVAIVVVVLLALPQIEYRQDPEGYFLITEDYDAYLEHLENKKAKA